MYKYFKSLMDFLVALVFFTLVFPVFALCTILLFFANQGHPFFLQPRPGKSENIFQIIKFKTMNDKKDAEGKLLPDHLRITKVGSIVRKTSLDEIPQLINILKGDMSFVGPRPLMVSYLKQYNDFQRRRHEVKPGISGWAQVNGRNAISWDQKFAFDVHYVDHMSFGLDLKILFLTVKKVFVREGISADGSATMPRFEGNKED